MIYTATAKAPLISSGLWLSDASKSKINVQKSNVREKIWGWILDEPPSILLTSTISRHGINVVLLLALKKKKNT